METPTVVPPPPRRVAWFITDFDGTLIEHPDTSFLLLHLAEQASPGTFPNRHELFDRLGKQFWDDVVNAEEEIEAAAKINITAAQHDVDPSPNVNVVDSESEVKVVDVACASLPVMDYTGLVRHLNVLDACSNRSVERLNASGVLASIPQSARVVADIFSIWDAEHAQQQAQAQRIAQTQTQTEPPPPTPTQTHTQPQPPTQTQTQPQPQPQPQPQTQTLTQTQPQTQTQQQTQQPQPQPQTQSQTQPQTQPQTQTQALTQSQTQTQQETDSLSVTQTTLKPRTAATTLPPQLLPGCSEALQAAYEQCTCGVGILTLSWCPPMVEATLSSALQRDCYTMWSSCVSTTGVITLGVDGAVKKREIIQSLSTNKPNNLRDHDENKLTPPPSESEGWTVYVGDSRTDLLALLAVDIGILVAQSESVRNFCKKYGVCLEPLPERIPCGYTRREGCIFEARDWNHIRKSLFDEHE